MTETEHANISGVQNVTGSESEYFMLVFVCTRDAFDFGIMSCRFAALPHSTTTFPPSSTAHCSPLRSHFQLSLCHLCYCQSCEPFLGRIIGTHICSWCNLVCVLSDTCLEEKLIIMVGGGDQKGDAPREGRVFWNQTLSIWLHHPPPLAPLDTLLAHCKVMSAPAATHLKGISCSMWGFPLVLAGTTYKAYPLGPWGSHCKRSNSYGGKNIHLPLSRL